VKAKRIVLLLANVLEFRYSSFLPSPSLRILIYFLYLLMTISTSLDQLVN